MKKFLSLLFLFLYSSLLIQAQMRIEIEDIGSFPAYLAEFGPNSPCDLDTIHVGIRLINDGTSERTGLNPYVDSSLIGKIAVIQRGSYDSVTKAKNAQDNGAVAAVICNWDETLGPVRGDSDLVTIPTMMMRSDHCNQFLMNYDSLNNYTAKIFSDLPIYNSNERILWGDLPDQGEFENGFGEWTTEDCYIHRQDSIFEDSIFQDVLSWNWYPNPIEQFFGAQLSSYSRCNGAAGYESTQWNMENGDLSHPNHYPDHYCSLVSPIIDLSFTIDTVKLQFWHLDISLNGNINPGDPISWLHISVDGGKTYPKKLMVPSVIEPILSQIPQSFGVTEIRQFVLPELTGQDSVRVKFEFSGDFYAWYIDDVYFIEKETTTSNDEEPDKKLSDHLFYPNPVSSFLYFSQDPQNDHMIEEIRIIDWRGNEVVKRQNKPKTIRVDHLPSGVYFIELSRQGGTKAVESLIKM